MVGIHLVLAIPSHYRHYPVKAIALFGNCYTRKQTYSLDFFCSLYASTETQTGVKIISIFVCRHLFSYGHSARYDTRWKYLFILWSKLWICITLLKPQSGWVTDLRSSIRLRPVLDLIRILLCPRGRGQHRSNPAPQFVCSSTHYQLCFNLFFPSMKTTFQN